MSPEAMKNMLKNLKPDAFKVPPPPPQPAPEVSVDDAASEIKDEL